jgi:MFS family permease
MLVFSESLGPPLMLIWMTQTRFEIFAASMVLFALTAATWVPTRNTFISHMVEPARRGEVFGRLAAFSGLIAFPSSFIGGFVYDRFGFAAPFIGNLIGSVLTVMVLVFFVREPPAPVMAEQSNRR